MKSLLENQPISDDEEVLTIQTFLKPFQLTTMKKFIDNPEYLEVSYLLEYLEVSHPLYSNLCPSHYQTASLIRDHASVEIDR